MRNNFHVEEEVMYISTPLNGNGFTASLQDKSVIEPYRWREYGGTVMTEIDGKFIPITTLLTNKHKDTRIKFLNENPLDFRRENMEIKCKAGSPSTITQGPEVSYLHLQNGINIKFDTKHVALVDAYGWHAITMNKKIHVRTNAGPTKLILHRALTGASRGEFVKHKNGDELDCTGANLTIINRK